MIKQKISKAVHDAGKALQNSKSSKKDKELAAKVLSDRSLKKPIKRNK